MAKKDLKTLIILIGVIVLLGAVAFAVIMIRGRIEKRKLEIAGNITNRLKLIELPEESVYKFRLTYSTNDIVAEKDKNGLWKITSPKKYAASQMECLGTVKDFNTLLITRVITNDVKRSEYGLDKIENTFIVWGKDGAHKIETGKKVLSEGYYVRYMGHTIYINELFIEPLKKELNTLRKKDFLAIDVVDVQAVNINDEFKFEKDGRTNAKFNKLEAADVNKIFDLFQDVATVEAIGFGKDKSVAKDYSLDKPQYTVTVTLTDRSEITFYISKYKGKFYAKRKDEENIYEVGPEFYESLILPISYYKREKK